ncbi:MAG: alpha/beta fold hydrolase [Bacteroidetes bacterium]|nr:alpha/beta fold hydrolase [Bacteroidota bacterium]
MQNLLLLHGALASHSQFNALKDSLKYTYNILSFDFSGHGNGAPTDAFTMEVFCDDIKKYLDEHFVQTTNIFGYSMGGYAALCFAQKYPNRVKKLITLGTNIFWESDYAKEEIDKLDPAKILEKVPAFAKDLERRHGANDWKKVLFKTAEMMVYLANEKPLLIFPSRLGGKKAPMLFIFLSQNTPW